MVAYPIDKITKLRELKNRKQSNQFSGEGYFLDSASPSLQSGKIDHFSC